MPRANSFSSYGSIAKTFHWLTALLIFSAFPLGYFANGLAQEIQSPGFDGSQAVIARATLLFSLHKTLGVTVFFTALLRILWALSQPKPGLLHPDRKAEALAAEMVHWLLYGSLVAVPLSGWIHHAATTGFAPIWWPFGQSLPFVPKSEVAASFFGGVHWVLVWTLGASLALHIAGALKHHVIDRDATLHRMLPGRADLPQPPAQTHSLVPLLAALAVWAGALSGGAMIGVYGGQDQRQAKERESGADGTVAPVVAAGPAAGGGWAVQSGTLGLSVTQMGSVVSGSFGEWDAVISFEEPAAPGPAGNVEVTVAIASLELGSVAGQAMGADYFDSANFPTALFKADIEKLAEGYQAAGTLTIKGQTVPVTLPFDLELEGNTAKMAGTLTLNRLDFGIGKSLPDESSLGFAVDVPVELEAVRAD
ncbi:cytochrome b/b6 domain-containing protein [Leisingera methylohalidivorans]|uniref:Cytochrome n=1 Tax=Leisingera methylohalidivorans DSM 14336 TaxID=999552 RepID=V9VQ77_9RHOB|nr:cytochrome b/b6 domain-containing protein [Leisingera methylohalidivorans]AHD00876.1 cytochrome [Leisingera methylohalidivorans DSM 14336]